MIIQIGPCLCGDRVARTPIFPPSRRGTLIFALICGVDDCSSTLFLCMSAVMGRGQQTTTSAPFPPIPL